MDNKEIKKIEERLTRLEKAVFRKRARVLKETALDEFGGLKGGISAILRLAGLQLFVAGSSSAPGITSVTPRC